MTRNTNIESTEPDETYRFKKCKASLTTGFKYADIFKQNDGVDVVEYDDKNVLSVELYNKLDIETIQKYLQHECMNEKSNTNQWAVRYSTGDNHEY
jgi:hypothetical protein